MRRARSTPCSPRESWPQPADEPTLITPLDPAGYIRTPWRNGGGVTVDIALDGDVWRFGRTPITAAGPFSDYAGFERLQVLVAGRGLVLETPQGDIDVRQPFRPVRFAGETPIVSRLEAGPVEVVNLIGDRSRVRLDLGVLEAGEKQPLGAGIHIAYCPAGPASLDLRGGVHALAAGHALRIEDEVCDLACREGLIVLGSVTCVLP
ncbi:HutD family protein [Reyranella sp.]|uniref:HutD/Ves family protein n=1 Tax=Reyranella sp. TaxID=1929291 RepID=UPI003BA91A97